MWLKRQILFNPGSSPIANSSGLAFFVPRSLKTLIRKTIISLLRILTRGDMKKHIRKPVAISLNQYEIDKLDEKARKKDMTRSEYVRELIKRSRI